MKTNAESDDEHSTRGSDEHTKDSKEAKTPAEHAVRPRDFHWPKLFRARIAKSIRRRARSVEHERESRAPVPKHLQRKINPRASKARTSTEEEPTTEETAEAEHQRREATYVSLMNEELKILSDRPYYHGLIPREDVEGYLKNDGDFLVRKTEIGKGPNLQERLAVSVAWKKRARHLLVKTKDERWYVQSEHSFDSVDGLITHYTVRTVSPHQLPLMQTTRADVQKDGAKLLQPVKRPEWYLLHENIVMGRKLGAGSFGDVFLGELAVDEGRRHIDVAIKTLRGRMGKQERVGFLKEAAIQRRFKHDHVLGLHGVAANQEPVLVVLEYCSGGQLLNYLKTASPARCNTATLSKFLLDAARGMEYLSNLDVIHRDLAARNCLLSAELSVKISDFGLSVCKEELKEKKRQKMAIRWSAPEVLRSYSFSRSSDVWAFGILMWEVYTRCQSDPYPGLSNAEVKRFLLEEQKRMAVPADVPPTSARLMKDCWLERAQDRPTFSAIVAALSGYDIFGVRPKVGRM